MSVLTQALTVAYASVGVLVTIGYLPTMKDLYFHKKRSANIQSYLIWTLCTAITLLYSIFILQDTLFRIVSGLNFLCCSVILALCLRLNYGVKPSFPSG